MANTTTFRTIFSDLDMSITFSVNYHVIFWNQEETEVPVVNIVNIT